MTRNMKALGLTLLAVLALGALAAQGASANVKHHFTSEVATTHLTATQHPAGNEHIFKAGTLQVKCKSAKFKGTQTGTTVESVTLTPEYSECKLGATNVTVHNEGCNYIFTTTTTTNPASTTEGESATVDLECNHTGRIVITGPGCEITFSDTHAGVEGTVNQNIHGVKYANANTSGKTEITTEAHNFGIKYTTKDTVAGACALVGKAPGTYSDGTYIGNATVKGYEDAAHEKQVGVSLTTT